MTLIDQQFILWDLRCESVLFGALFLPLELCTLKVHYKALSTQPAYWALQASLLSSRI